jgi:hypothetical protein
MIKYLITLLLLIPSLAFPDAARDSIKTGANDCDSIGDGGGFSSSRSSLTFGLYQGDDFSVSLTFDSVNVPQGATINSAVITVVSDDAYSGQTINLKIAAVDVDNASPFTQDSDFNNPTLTTAKVDWDLTDNWTFEGSFSTVDISTVIQEIVDRGSWVAENNINLLIYNDGSSGDNSRAFMSADHGDGLVVVPKLIIDYTEALAGIYKPGTIKKYILSSTDSYISGQDFLPDERDDNFGSDTTMRAYDRSANIRKMLLKFDLSDIPATATIDSVYLRLVRLQPTSNVPDLFLNRVTTPWVESEVTWNDSEFETPWTTPGGDFTDAEFDSLDEQGLAVAPDVIFFSGGVGSNLVNQVEDWVDGTNSNYGWLITTDYDNGPSSSNYIWCGTDETVTTGFKPFLYVEYTPASITGTDTTTLDGSSEMDDVYLDKGAQSTNRDEVWLYSAIETDNSNYFNTLIQVDLSGISAGSNIDSVNFWIMERPFGGADMHTDGDKYGIFPVTAAWIETQATWIDRITSTAWSTAGGDFGSLIDSFAPGPAGEGANAIWCPSADGGGLTEFIQDIVNGTEDNNGFAIIKFDISGTDTTKFNSSGNFDESDVNDVRPKFYIEYTPAGDVVSTRRRKVILSY